MNKLTLVITALLLVLSLEACRSQPAAPVVDTTTPAIPAIPTIPAKLQALVDEWNDPEIQTVEPFQIFDNLYYVGIKWVAAYVLETSEGLILIDSLYGQWVTPMLANIRKLGLDPNDIRYVLVTHGHFDHAGGAAEISRRFGATVVMTAEDWALAREPATIAAFAMDVPENVKVAADGDVIELGDTSVELFKTPGHTPGVLSLRYPVRDGDQTYTAITLGGVGLNFSGVERTEAYLKSFHRLQSEIAKGASVSLPNHAQMGSVFTNAQRLAVRQKGQPHPFVNERDFQKALTGFIARAEEKLAAEKSGTAKSALETLADSDSE